jgi:hypothetical protein
MMTIALGAGELFLLGESAANWLLGALLVKAPHPWSGSPAGHAAA